MDVPKALTFMAVLSVAGKRGFRSYGHPNFFQIFLPVLPFFQAISSMVILLSVKMELEMSSPFGTGSMKRPAGNMVTG